jgi:hypothetical protein
VSSSFQAGRTSVAAAVVDSDGRPLGGLSVAGPTTLFPRAVLLRTAQDVVAAADRARLAVRGPGAAVPRQRRSPLRSPPPRSHGAEHGGSTAVTGGAQ